MALLPARAVVDEVLAALQSAAQVMLHAPTGAGKSTWLPLEILRRGGLAVVTEGILTRQLQQDPTLDGVSLVILDEFHERSLQADLALALLLDVQRGLRDDLMVLIMSATLDDRRLSQLLPEAPVIRSEGRSYPVERRYQALPAQTQPEEATAGAVQQLLRQQPGSLLLFLPGVAEIKRVQGLLGERVAADVLLCALSLEAQQRAIQPAPAGRRKVVLATNIAETSLTIEGIRLVVDSGLERVAEFDPRSGLSRLITRRISQASMAQRAGRAAVCGRMLASVESGAGGAPEHHAPEITYADLAPLWLEMLQWGVRERGQLTWLDAPPAVDNLTGLGAIDARQNLTPAGRAMAGYGCDPRLGAVLYHAGEEADAVARSPAAADHP